MVRSIASFAFLLVAFCTSRVVEGGHDGPKILGKNMDTLIASMGNYPGYDGKEIGVTGIVSVRFNDDGAFFVHVDVQGLEPNSMGTVQLHEGTTCENEAMSGGHYYRPDDHKLRVVRTPDGVASWTSDEDGRSISSFRLSNGYGPKEYAGNTVVVLHHSYGRKVACGVLVSNSFVLTAEMGPYPAYDGNAKISPDIRVTGDFTLYFDADGHFEVVYDLRGLPKNCYGCGVHVHTGTTCNDHIDIGGHYFTASAGDLWTAEGGAVYNSNSGGNAKGSFFLFDGFNFVEHVHHAVVVHAKGGERIACGILML